MATSPLTSPFERRLHVGAGPSALPLDVLLEAQRELLCFESTGISVLEMSHRSAPFERILRRAQEALAALYGLSTYGGGGSEAFELLFLQGGASLQFSMVPLHYGAGGAYLNSGTWSTRAIEEAELAWGVGSAHTLWSGEAGGFKALPSPEQRFEVPHNTPYVHYTSNNTIYGTQLRAHPQLSAPTPLVIDASSDFISRPLELAPCELVYAGAQKNAGPAGVTIVMGRPEVLRRAPRSTSTPTTLRYSTHATKDSLYNTPPTFGIYLVALTSEWALKQGGLEALARRAEARSGALYRVIDAHPSLYQGHAAPAARSHMNVTFRASTEALEAELLKEASARGLTGLKGHRSVGGLRASLYNAVTDESVEALISLLEGFARAGA